MLDISKINLTLSQLANGGPVIATDSSPMNPFRDGHLVTDEVVGRKITVVFPDNGYETQEIKVSDPTDTLTPLLKQASFAHPVLVDFEGFSARIYLIKDKITGQKNLVLSTKADKVRVIPSTGDDFLVE